MTLFIRSLDQNIYILYIFSVKHFCINMLPTLQNTNMQHSKMTLLKDNMAYVDSLTQKCFQIFKSLMFKYIWFVTHNYLILSKYVVFKKIDCNIFEFKFNFVFWLILWTLLSVDVYTYQVVYTTQCLGKLQCTILISVFCD